MKYLSVIQHTQSEWLGHMEDHLEGRGIRFGYHRPFTTGGTLPQSQTIGDGLILIGGGSWGSITPGHILPTLDAEVRLARACLMLNKPVIGIGLGAHQRVEHRFRSFVLEPRRLEALLGELQPASQALGFRQALGDWKTLDELAVPARRSIMASAEVAEMS